MKRLIFLCLVCSLLLLMAHNSNEKVPIAPAINEPPKETKLDSAAAESKPDYDKKYLNREFYRIDSHNNNENNVLNTGDQPVFDFDLKKFAKKMREFNPVLAPASRQHQMPKKLIGAVIRYESNWDIYAKSEKGAEGLMQLKPETQEETEVKNPYDPKQNINGGTQYLKQMCDMFGSIELGVIAYKIGPTRLKSILANDGEIPPSAIKYAQKIMYLYQNA